jgi:hypothetical protein
MRRRTLLQAMLGYAFAYPALARAASKPLVEVYKSEGCGCCEGWIAHLEAHGFAVNAQNVPDTGVYRRRFGMPDALGSCHSARVQGYAIEGHVPASEIRRLLAERPKALGLAVPAMPPGSPGMEGPNSQPYDVLLVSANGATGVYRHYSGASGHRVQSCAHCTVNAAQRWPYGARPSGAMRLRLLHPINFSPA